MNAVEGFFGKLANRRLRRGVHDSLEDLKAATDGFIELHNGKEAKPFKWTVSPDRLIAARQRGFQMILTSHYRPFWRRALDPPPFGNLSGRRDE